MARFIILLVATLASVQGNAVNRIGWSSSSTTPGWSAPPTEPPTEPSTTTTAGWSAPPSPPQSPGWGPPPPPSNVSINLDGSLAAVGSGWAGESHAENIHVSGGWGVPADLLVSAGGESTVVQEGSILQVTNVDSESATSLNAVSVEQVAAADEGQTVLASGLDIAVGESGWAGASGEGASAVAGDTSIVVNQ